MNVTIVDRHFSGMYGKRHSENTKDLISKKKKGKPISQTNRKNISLSLRRHYGIKNLTGWSLHKAMRNKILKPELCQICNKKPSLDLANISGKYLEEIYDWQWLCRTCHMLSDNRMYNLKNQVKPVT